MEYGKPYKYGMSVRISNWQDRMQAYPIDNPYPNRPGASHYRTLGDSDFVFIPLTSTQDQLQSGVINKTEFRQISRKQINFVSYPMNDFRFDNYEAQANTKQLKIEPLTTTYNEVYKAPKPLWEKIDCCRETVDPLLNRIPKNDFEMLPTSTTKFMDDHLADVSQGRKKINFLRQMRNSTYFMNYVG